MRPIVVFVPAKPAFIILLILGALLTLVGLAVPRLRKSQAFSYGWFLLVASLVAGRVGTGAWLLNAEFWHSWGRPWDPIPIYTYGVMLCLSLIGGWYLALKLAGEEGLP